MKQLYYFFLLIMMSSTTLLAQGSDAANDSAYNSGWANGTNGGTGFSAWEIATNTSFAGTFLATSGTDIAVDGDSWGMYANTNNTAQAIRPLTGSTMIGDLVQIEMENGSIQSGGVVGVSFRNNFDDNLLEVYFRGGDANYYYNDAGGESASSIGYTSTGLRINMKITSANSYELVLTNISTGSNQIITGNFSSTAGSQNISRVRLFNFNAGSGASNDQFFNSLVWTRPMPVTFAGLSAKPVGSTHQIDFATSSEDNNEYFVVERSTNQRSWQELGKINGSGTTQQFQNYQFVDRAPALGTNYYRIKQVDFDGTFAYSTIVSLQRIGDVISVYPNPSSDYLQLAMTQDDANITVELYDITGQLQLATPWQGQAISLSQLPAGIYQLRLLQGQEIIQQTSLIVQ